MTLLLTTVLRVEEVEEQLEGDSLDVAIRLTAGPGGGDQGRYKKQKIKIWTSLMSDLTALSLLR